MHLLIQIIFQIMFVFSSLYSHEFVENESGLQKRNIHASPMKVQKAEHEQEPFELTLASECEPLATVGGCVNVISGHFFQFEKDLNGNTIEPLDLVRYYDSGNSGESMLGFGFGSQFPLWASEFQFHIRHHYGLISEREGFSLPYRDKENGTDRVCSIDPRVLREGYTNLSRAVVSGHANFVNWKATFSGIPKFFGGWNNGKWILILGDGTQRIYDKEVRLSKEQKKLMRFPTKVGYLLTKEIKPNGNQLEFSYELIRDKHRLTHVKTLNRTGKLTLNELSFNHLPNKQILVQSSIGHVEYDRQNILEPYLTRVTFEPQYRNFLRKAKSSQKGELDYQYLLGDFPGKIITIKKPRNRYLEIEYYSSGQVKSLSEPLETADAVTRYQFQYKIDETQVTDALGQLTTYIFDDHRRISSINYLNDQSKEFRKDLFQWSSEEGKEGWLKFKSIQHDKQIYYLKDYQYDERGNIIRESLYGNLKGNKPETFTLAEKKSVDCSSIEFSYYKNEFNLLKEKTTQEGLSIAYEYLAGTNLCTKILSKNHGIIQKRIFKTYDDNAQLKTLIEDDGSNEQESILKDVTYRKIQEIESVTETGPSFGKPKKIVESYFDSKTKKAIKKKEIVLSYDEKGCEIERKFKDAKGNDCFSLTKKYDDRLRLIEESNVLGDLTKYEYDESNNKISEELTGSGKKICYEYDLGNRLIKKTDTHDNGEIFISNYTYNALNQLISQKDHYDQETSYKYDRLGNEIQIVKPQTKDSLGNLVAPTITKSFNLLNQMTSKKDERGDTTTYSYNAYGSPVKITHPNGIEETFSYYTCGWLEKKMHADGTSISYSYDPNGQLTEEKYLDKEGKTIKEEKYHYKGSLLQSKQDSMGLISTYQYDGAGRKIKETIGDLKTITYAYDDFDRLIKKEHDSRQEIIEYDWLDRQTAKIYQDSLGNLYSKQTFEYDIHGNEIKKTLWQSNELACDYQAKFYSDGTPCYREDPLENRTTYQYDHQVKNVSNQKVQSRNIIDSKNRPVKEEDNIFNQIAKREHWLDKQKLSCENYDYDLAGQLIKHQIQVMEGEQSLREYSICRTYNNRGLIETEVEMPAEKKTTFTYDSMGRLEKKVKPNGVTLNHHYDFLGRLQRLDSSDKSVDYLYTYDLHDNLIRIDDQIHKMTQLRDFDSFDRLTKEEINPGMIISYTFDVFDRPIKMTLPDNSTVVYEYDAYRLNKIQRKDSSEELNYEIKCLSYDWQGHLLESQSPAGKISYTYDKLGRQTAIKAPLWESNYDEFDSLGNLIKLSGKNPSGMISEQFAYNRFNHVTSECETKYEYDSLGNCLKKNNLNQTINSLNQVTKSNASTFTYDLNGNLTAQSDPSVKYTYDALDRLIAIEKEGAKTTLLYDALNRCIQITNSHGTKKLLYQGNQEIGSQLNETMKEFRLLHPEQEITFAIELEKEQFFPLQDQRGNICALQKADGSIRQWIHYSAFGEKTIKGVTLENPWLFNNRREVCGLTLFTHRFYNPTLMRWQTPDPLGFEDGLNLYTYVRNNPHLFKDPDGRFVFVIPIFIGVFGPSGIVITGATVGAIAGTVAGAAIGVVTYKAVQSADHKFNEIEADSDENEKKEKKYGVYAPNRPLPRDKYGKPIPDADVEHTQLGQKESSRRDEIYPQAREFDKNGRPIRDIDFSDHGYPKNHPSPHQHKWIENETGGTPKRSKDAEPLENWNYI